MSDLNCIKSNYEKYKADKAMYDKELYLKESKEKECINKILENKKDLNDLGILDIKIDKNRLNDPEYVVNLTSEITKIYDRYISEADSLLKGR